MMWYDAIPDISVLPWLGSVVELFSAVLRCLTAQPVFSFLLALLLFLALVKLTGALFRRGKQGGL